MDTPLENPQPALARLRFGQCRRPLGIAATAQFHGGTLVDIGFHELAGLRDIVRAQATGGAVNQGERCSRCRVEQSRG